MTDSLQSHDYRHLIGTDLVVGDSDNQSFAAYLPRTGTVVRQIALDRMGREYQLGSLDSGFRTQHRFHSHSWAMIPPLGPQRKLRD
jgi:hypothetical protein